MLQSLGRQKNLDAPGSESKLVLTVDRDATSHVARGPPCVSFLRHQLR